MSKDESGDSSFGAYDHLKKEVAKKQVEKVAGSGGAGIPTVMKVFILGLVIFGGLMASGLLTGPDPFGGSQDSEFQGQYIPEGESNYQLLTDMCVTHSGGVGDHYHFKVRILIDGQQQNVPANIGIVSDDCMRPLHTHDSSGKVHVELPSSYSGNNPNIGDFFEIWGHTFSETELLGQTGEVTMTVNSQEKSGNLQFYIPQNNDFIEIKMSTN